MAKHAAHILELARIGAEIQLRDLLQEIRYLLDLFPHLRDSFSEDDLPLALLMAEPGRTAKSPGDRPRSKRAIPASGRRAAGRGAKRDWPGRKRSTKR